MPTSICACVNGQIVWTVDKAEARLLIQHSSSSNLNIVTASLRLHFNVNQMRSATGGFSKSASYISLQTGVLAIRHLVKQCDDLQFGLKLGSRLVAFGGKRTGRRPHTTFMDASWTFTDYDALLLLKRHSHFESHTHFFLLCRRARQVTAVAN